eukprot:25906-Chlamydomonas_euryale.AAC.2
MDRRMGGRLLYVFCPGCGVWEERGSGEASTCILHAMRERCVQGWGGEWLGLEVGFDMLIGTVHPSVIMCMGTGGAVGCRWRRLRLGTRCSLPCLWFCTGPRIAAVRNSGVLGTQQ